MLDGDGPARGALVAQRYQKLIHACGAGRADRVRGVLLQLLREWGVRGMLGRGALLQLGFSDCITLGTATSRPWSSILTGVPGHVETTSLRS